LCVRARRGLYEADLLARADSALPVIVVGNISVGGTGKSPIVAWLAQQLKAQGLTPGIVSRGYGGTHRGGPLLVQPDTDPRLAGDEPVMLAATTGCPVCVCADRVAAVEAIAKQGADVVISDDGLQHYRMRRVAEFVVIDGDRGLGNAYLLPAGPLREPPSRLEQADALLLNGGSDSLKGSEFRLLPVDAVALSTGARCSLAEFAGARVWAVAGIGNPGRFYSMLEEHGIQPDPVDVPDHGVYPLAELVLDRRQPILMTEKDAVKYRHNPPEDAWFVPVTVEFDPADAARLLELVGRRINRT
jgi:tetraacyldisaccharide 4'-kinase